jgi:hypothetical protein
MDRVLVEWLVSHGSDFLRKSGKGKKSKIEVMIDLLRCALQFGFQRGKDVAWERIAAKLRAMAGEE